MQERNIPEKCCSIDLCREDQDKYVKIIKAMGNPIRFEIIKFLWTHPGCITGDIVDYLPIAQSTTSRHLGVLKDAGLITGTINKTSTSYILDEDLIHWYRNITADIFK